MATHAQASTPAQAKYQAEFKAAQHKPAPVHAADREIERLRGELSKARDDRRHHEQLTRAYALIINQLTEELEATKAERDALLDTPAIARLPADYRSEHCLSWGLADSGGRRNTSVASGSTRPC